MIILGVVLLLLGIFLPMPLLFWLGVALLIVGALFLVLGRTGRPVGGRANWF